MINGLVPVVVVAVFVTKFVLVVVTVDRATAMFDETVEKKLTNCWK